MRRILPYLFYLVVLTICSVIYPQELVAQDWQATIPYTESFDDDSHYTDDASMPNGWLAVGSNTFYTTHQDDWGTKAVSGERYIWAHPSYSSKRKDIAFTPVLKMKGGAEYNISYYLFMPGGARNSSFKMTVGNAQDETVHTNVLVEKMDMRITQWEKIEVTFTPETDGEYCFAFWACSVLSNDGFFGIDEFIIDGEPYEETPDVEWEASMPYDETFDDPTHYAKGATVPAGWLSTGSNPFKAVSKKNSEIMPLSGDTLVIAPSSAQAGRKDILYSPVMQLKANKSYDISVNINMPGATNSASFKLTAGNLQEETSHALVIAEVNDTKTQGWQKVEAKFTPESDGEYCIGLWACSASAEDGVIAIDNFSMAESEEPEEPAWEASIPYIESFDDQTHYSGEDFLPIGWFSSGEYPFFTASIKGVTAVTGEYYMLTTTSILTSRQDIAYSPLLEMKAGQEYNVSFYLYMPGDGNPGKFKFTVGQEQAYDMHDNVLLEIKDRKVTKWEKQEVTFTPETDGEYCFAFWACSETPFDGYYAIDDFVLRRADDVVKPSCNFQFGNTMYSIIEGNHCVFTGQNINLINMSENADSYKWTVNNGGQISDENAANPELIVTKSGSYEVTLTATNKGGSNSIKRTMHVIVLEEGETYSDAWTTTNDVTDKIFSQGDTPSYIEDGSVQDYNTYEVYFDYVVGVNDYYKCFAERFVLPHNQEITINSVSINVLMYNLHIRTVENYVDDSKKEFSMIIYGEKDGKPDTENPLGTVRKTLAEVFGDAGYYQPVRHGIKFDTPVNVKGTFYVALEFDELVLHPEGTVVERSFFGADTRYHLNNETTLYVKPEKAIPGSDFKVTGDYCKADEFCPALKGYSFGATPWINIDKVVTDVEECFENELFISVDGNELRVSDLSAGDNVSIYSVSGQLMWNGNAADTEIYVPVSSWESGVYIITVNGKSAKFII